MANKRRIEGQYNSDNRLPPNKQRRLATSAQKKQNRAVGNGNHSAGIAVGSLKGVKLGPKGKGKRSIHDVYEASDDDENERRILARRGGGGGEVGRTLDNVDNYEYIVDTIAEEDDEEIDEDEAFGESDEEKYGSFFAEKGSEEKRITRDAALLSEGEENRGSEEEDEENGEDEEEDPDAYMDLSEMLSSEGTKSGTSKSKNTFDELLPKTKDELNDSFEDWDGLEDEDEEDEADTDGSVNNDAASMDAEEEVADRLSSFVQALEGKRARQKKRRRVADQTEAFNESEYNVSSGQGTAAARKKIGLEDLMGSLADETGFGNLKKQLAGLEKEKAKESTVAAPLPKRIQDRHHREAAYEEAKRELTKWIPIVKKNREASHLLLPTIEPATANISSGALVGKFEATTSLESEVQKLLQESALLEKNQKEAEELELKKISKEELLERRAELAKMRALLFYKEQKQKKVAKIKSKAYRKLHKKDKATADLSLEELKRLDPELARQEREKLEAQRAQERMTLKHKNTGKWAKQMLGRANDSETQKAVMEQLNKHEALKRRIKGLESDESDEDESDDGGDVDDEAIRQRAMASLDQMERDKNNEHVVPQKGVFAMKFMQRALEKQKKEAQEQIQQARNGIRDDFRSSDDESELNSDREEARGGASQTKNEQFPMPRHAGQEDDDDILLDDGDGFAVRVAQPINIGVSFTLPKQSPLFPVESFQIEEVHDTSFIGTANRRDVELLSASTKQAESAPAKATPQMSVRQTTMPVMGDVQTQSESEHDDNTQAPRYTDDSDNETEINPWLAGTADTKAVKKSLNVSTSHKGSKTGKAIEKMSQKRKGARQAELNASIGDVQLVLDGVRALETAAPTPIAAPSPSSSSIQPTTTSKTLKRDTAKEAALSAYSESDDDSDVEAGLKMVHASQLKSVSRLSQRELMQMAFANDDVAAEFEEEKLRIMDQEKPQDEDLTLPGWGSWGGIGIAPKKNVVVKKAKPGQGVNEDKRKDAKLKHVIINEKRLKKAVKYMAPMVPHGFENREQYERTIRAPLGKEWNAASAHSDMVKPRVQNKLGTVIAPLKLASSKSQAKKVGKGKAKNQRS